MAPAIPTRDEHLQRLTWLTHAPWGTLTLHEKAEALGTAEALALDAMSVEIGAACMATFGAAPFLRAHLPALPASTRTYADTITYVLAAMHWPVPPDQPRDADDPRVMAFHSATEQKRADLTARIAEELLHIERSRGGSLHYFMLRICWATASRIWWAAASHPDGSPPQDIMDWYGAPLFGAVHTESVSALATELLLGHPELMLSCAPDALTEACGDADAVQALRAAHLTTPDITRDRAAVTALVGAPVPSSVIRAAMRMSDDYAPYIFPHFVGDSMKTDHGPWMVYQITAPSRLFMQQIAHLREPWHPDPGLPVRPSAP